MSAADRLAQIKARVAAATPGPWHLDGDGARGVYSEAKVSRTSSDVAHAWERADEVFIAHAREDIPALLAAVEAVLALHSPRAEAVLSDPDCLREECDHEGACPLGGSVTVCAACWVVAEESYHYFCEQGIPDEVLHPCSTVRAITEALA